MPGVVDVAVSSQHDCGCRPTMGRCAGPFVPWAELFPLCASKHHSAFNTKRSLFSLQGSEQCASACAGSLRAVAVHLHLLSQHDRGARRPRRRTDSLPPCSGPTATAQFRRSIVTRCLVLHSGHACNVSPDEEAERARPYTLALVRTTHGPAQRRCRTPGHGACDAATAVLSVYSGRTCTGGLNREVDGASGE